MVCYVFETNEKMAWWAQEQTPHSQATLHFCCKIKQESKVDKETATKLAKIAQKIRNLQERGLNEGVSTRLLIHAAKLIHSNVPPRVACNAAFVQTLSDDVDMSLSIEQLVTDFF